MILIEPLGIDRIGTAKASQCSCAVHLNRNDPFRPGFDDSLPICHGNVDKAEILTVSDQLLFVRYRRQYRFRTCRCQRIPIQLMTICVIADSQHLAGFVSGGELGKEVDDGVRPREEPFTKTSASAASV